MRLPRTADEKVLARAIFHFLLPIIATLLFWWVLYESIFPIASPLEWSPILWLLVLAPAVIYALRKNRGLDPQRGHQLGVDPDAQ